MTPRLCFGRFVSVVVMPIGISLFGVAIAQLSAGLMIEALKSDISGPDELGGRSLATVAGTAGAEVAIRYGARLREVEEIGAAYRLLKSGEVDAILFDPAPQGWLGGSVSAACSKDRQPASLFRADGPVPSALNGVLAMHDGIDIGHCSLSRARKRAPAFTGLRIPGFVASSRGGQAWRRLPAAACPLSDAR